MKVVRRLWCRWFGHKWVIHTTITRVDHSENWARYSTVCDRMCVRCGETEYWPEPLGTHTDYCTFTVPYNFTDCNPDS